MIYFLRHVETGSVKIGTAKYFHERLQQLERQYGELEILGMCAGSQAVESRLHEKFSHLKTDVLGGREWFNLDSEIIEHIEKLSDFEPKEYFPKQVRVSERTLRMVRMYAGKMQIETGESVSDGRALQMLFDNFCEDIAKRADEINKDEKGKQV